MKTAIIISDTHNNIRAIERLLPIMNECDFVFHLGDHDTDLNCFLRDIKAEVVSVKGNCDGGGKEKVLTIEDVKCLLTHGDRFDVKNSLYKLGLKAKEVGVNVVFFGHTHQSLEENFEGVKLINPGAMTSYGINSYCYAVFHKGKVTVKIVELCR